MAVKKTELYSSLWASCDALRGGMDASQYKDYILTLLFMKYVTDKYKGQKYGDLTVFDKEHDPNPDPEKRTGCSFDDFIALKNKKNIGEGIDKIIARLAEVNDSLKGVIDIAHFNDEAKIGKGQEMVDKLTKLIAIFQRPELDFSNNKADGDDIIGDAYEYLMRNFATESGKSKGQFYTPAEVSRILAKVIGIDKCTDHDATVCEEKFTTIRQDEEDMALFMERLRKYTDVQELTREMCLKLIEYITLDAYVEGQPREIYINYKLLDEPLKDKRSLF